MEVINPHSLLEKEVKTIAPSSEMTSLFNMWKQLMKEKSNDGISLFDGFLAGYFLGCNYSLRLEFKKLIEIENYDNRLKNPLHEKTI